MRRILVESTYAVLWRELLEGITLFVRERHLHWELHCVSNQEFVRGLAQRPDGILSILMRDQHDLIDAIRDAGVPAVNMLRNLTPLIPSVVTDHAAIGRRAADYFLNRGFQHFAFVGPDREWSLGRLAGFREHLAQKGRTVHLLPNHLTITDLKAVTNRTVLRTLEKWLPTLPRPIAVFGAADFVARTVLEACRNVKLSVPAEVALLGVDNDVTICELAPVPLSSIPQNSSRIGFESARLLEGLLARRRRPRGPVVIPPRDLVVRRSTDFIAVEDARVAAALRMIHAPQPQPVTTKDVLRAAGVSRQWLDRRFKEILGRTPSEEIRRLKLERARTLLLETHLTIQQIAEKCGFTHAENLSRFFHDSLHTSPRQYRRLHRPAAPSA